MLEHGSEADSDMSIVVMEGGREARREGRREERREGGKEPERNRVTS